MKWIKYILKLVGYYLVNIFIFLICIPSKLGVGKNLCAEFKASKDLGAGSGAYLRGEYEKSYQILKPYLDLPDDRCYGGIKYQLALLFYYGNGVNLNRETANSLFEESASLGWDDAVKYLADLKDYGND